MTRILVVEDDPSIRMGLEDTLTAKGYEVEVVGKGGDGADKALGGRFDLVVLDVMLPDIDGFEVLRRIRGGKRIELPSRAFAILKVFAKRPGEVVSRDVLLDEAWGYEDYPNTRTVDNHLVKLRRALEDEPDKPRWLVTIHGAGYKLDVPRDAVRFARSVTRS